MEQQNSNQDTNATLMNPYYDEDGYIVDLYSLPPGFRFLPSDEELILHYLDPKIKSADKKLSLIHEVNIYEHNPDYLAETFEAKGDKYWYFLTPRDRKYPNGKRPSRTAGNGYWKATGADKVIKKDGKEVGFRKSLVFYMRIPGKPRKGVKTSWIMHEFKVAVPSRTNKRKRNCKDEGTSMRLDDYVLCSIHKKEEKGSKKQPVELIQENEDDAEGTEYQEEQAGEETETSSASFLGSDGLSNIDIGAPQTMSYNENININSSMMNNATPVDNCYSTNQVCNFAEYDFSCYNLSTICSTSYGANEYLSQQAVLPPNFEVPAEHLLESPSNSMYTSEIPAWEDLDELSKMLQKSSSRKDGLPPSR